MTTSLTFDLVVRPDRGWQRLTATESPVPAPLLHVAAVAAGSVGLAFLGALAQPGATVGKVTVILLATVAGFVGSCVLCARVAPAIIGGREQREMLTRLAGVAAIPVCATGVAYLAPWELSWWLTSLLGCVLTARSASIGTRRMLGRTGVQSHTTAAVVAALAGAPVLALAAFRSAG